MSGCRRIRPERESDTEIALALHLSEATVKSHVGANVTKLGLRDRTAVIVYAFDHGVVNPSS